MKYTISYGVISVLLVLLSCAEQKSDKKTKPSMTDKTEVMHVVPHPDSLLSSDAIFSSIEYLPLESTREAIIGNIKKILVTETRIYIFDDLQNAIICFDREGSYIDKFSNTGRGPDEYLRLNDFDLLDDGNGVVVLADYEKLFTLNRNLEIVSFRKLPFSSLYGPLVLSEEIYSFYIGHIFRRSVIDASQRDNHYSLFFYNINSSEYIGLLNNDIVDKAIIVQQPLIRSDKLIFFDEDISIAHSISSSGINKKWHLDLTHDANYKPPLLGNVPMMPEKILQPVIKGKWMTYVMIYRSSHENGSEGRMLLHFYDMDNGSAWFGLREKHLNSFIGVDYFNFTDGFLGVVDAHGLNLWLSNNNGDDLPKELLEVDTLDNPVIIFYYVTQ